jgi:hypothetical protein
MGDDELGTLRWFGDSWDAPVCDPRAHVDTPVGSPCWGHEHLHGPLRPAVIEDGDQGVTLPYYPGEQTVVTIAYHLRCWLHEVGVDLLE